MEKILLILTLLAAGFGAAAQSSYSEVYQEAGSLDAVNLMGMQENPDGSFETVRVKKGLLAGGAPVSGSLDAIRVLIGSVATGKSNAYLFCVGDGTTSGYGGYVGGTYFKQATNSWPYDLELFSKKINSDGWMGVQYPNAGIAQLPIVDPRVISPGGFKFGTSGPFAKHGMDDRYNTNAFVFQTTQPADYCLITYNSYSGGTPFIVCTNGVQAGNPSSYLLGVAQSIFEVDFGLTNKIQISVMNTNLNGGDVNLIGMIFGVKNQTLNVINCGTYNLGVADLTNTSSLYGYLISSTNLMSELGNSAVVVDMGITDASNDSPISQAGMLYHAFLDPMRSIGPVILMRPNPIGASPDSLTSLGYDDFLESYAQSNNVPLLDINQRWGGWTKAVAAGLIYHGNPIYPTGAGYYDISRFLFKALDLPAN